MIFIKWTMLIVVFLITWLIGIMLANRYKARVTQLKDMKSALNILKTKMQYTYEPLPDIFLEIAFNFQNDIRFVI